LSTWSEKRVLVTGGAGFIGHRAVARLVESGAHVTVVDNLSKGNLNNLRTLKQQIEFRDEDLLTSGSLKGILKDTDACFHLAAKIGGIAYFHKTPASSLRENSIMNFRLWDAAIDTDCLMVCLSSSMVFERTTAFPTPETAVTTSPPPLTGYGFSKLVAEYVARTYFEEFGVRFLIMRPFNAYGPGELPGDYVGYAHVIPDLIEKTLSGQYPLQILGDGGQTRSYTFVDDIADALLYAADHFESDDFNIGTGVETKVIDLARSIWDLCGRTEPFQIEPTASLKYDVVRRVPDVTKLFQKGWRPKHSLDEGLRITIDWLKTKRTSDKA